MRSAFDYIKRLLRIEQAKAKERELAGVKDPSENSHKGRSDEATAEQFGISSNTMRRELFIADNADMLDPAASCDGSMGFCRELVGRHYSGPRSHDSKRSTPRHTRQHYGTNATEFMQVGRRKSQYLVAYLAFNLSTAWSTIFLVVPLTNRNRR